MSELVKEIIKYGCIFLSSTLGTAIIGAIIAGSVKGFIAKHSAKNDIKQIYNDAVKAGVEEVKTVSFEQTVQPVVESGLERVNEKSQEFITKSYAEVKESYNNIIKILEGLAKYFDSSIVIPKEKKDEVHKLIEEAKEVKIEPQIIKVESQPKLEPVEENKPAIKVER